MKGVSQRFHYRGAGPGSNEGEVREREQVGFQVGILTGETSTDSCRILEEPT